MPAVVAFDIDGTLLTDDKRVLPSTLAAISRLEAAGATVMLASGRPVHGLAALARAHGIGMQRLLLAGCNGAHLVQAASQRTLWVGPLDDATAQRIFDLIRPIDGATAFVFQDDRLVVEDPDGFNIVHECAVNELRLQVVPDLGRAGLVVHKTMVSAHPDRMVELLPQLRASLGALADLALSAPFYLEVNARGVDKGAALRHACELAGVGLESSMAFGDHENDLPMLRAAGRGIAMGNAIPQVLAAADEVTLSNEQGGIAAVLDRLV